MAATTNAATGLACKPLSCFNPIYIYHLTRAYRITMNNVSKTKIAIGYALLIAGLVVSLLFVRREMDNLTQAEGGSVQWADSLLQLVRQKDANTIGLLKTISRANQNIIPAEELERILSTRDSIRIQPQIVKRTVTHQDTIVTKPKRKSFFRRLGEVFVPPKQDTSIQVKTSHEFHTDTIVDNSAMADTLEKKLREATQQQREATELVQRRQRTLNRLNRQLTARIDTLVRNYEETTLTEAHQAAMRRQAARIHSARMIGGVAAGAVVLAAIFLAIIGRDITRSNRYRRQLEEARRRAEDLLAMREKMMLAITHDFKAPLGSIIGYADLLSRLTVDERQRFYLNNMKASSQLLLRLVVDLLEFHRLDQGKAEVHRVAFRPSHLMEEIVTGFEPVAAAKGLALRNTTDPALDGSFISDPIRIRQIADNLLSNAIKFTDSGSVSLAASYSNRHLVLTITDTGKGMEPADRERIFQEFTRLPGAQGKEGFGLGLSIVRMLVQLLEGDISVDSIPGKGSTFTVRIPIYPLAISKDNAHAETPLSATSTTGPTEALDHPLQVLLIDDDRIQLQLTQAMLGSAGISTCTCIQVDEVLDALRTNEFDVLLTDVQMPALSGIDLLKLLRASNIHQAQTIPVIAVTARSDAQREQYLSLGFAGLLHKPFTVQELLSEVRGTPLPHRSAQGNGLNFQALLAFAGQDEQARHDILQSFIKETHTNAERLRTAIGENDPMQIAAIAHKMLPLFRMLGAQTAVTGLEKLERGASAALSDELREVANNTLADIPKIVAAAQACCS